MDVRGDRRPGVWVLFACRIRTSSPSQAVQSVGRRSTASSVSSSTRGPRSPLGPPSVRTAPHRRFVVVCHALLVQAFVLLARGPARRDVCGDATAAQRRRCRRRVPALGQVGEHLRGRGRDRGDRGVERLAGHVGGLGDARDLADVGLARAYLIARSRILTHALELLDDTRPEEIRRLADRIHPGPRSPTCPYCLVHEFAARGRSSDSITSDATARYVDGTQKPGNQVNAGEQHDCATMHSSPDRFARLGRTAFRTNDRIRLK